MELNSLTELYVDQLKDLYSAETQILKALPKMAKAASHPELQRAFQRHQRETERQVERLERIFRELGESPRGKKCVGMEGLIEEGQELIKERPDPDVLDAGLIAKAQHVEHYEMAGYGTVRTYAEQLGRRRDAELLQQTLEEEKTTDKLLTQLAESSINLEAEEPGEQGAQGRRGSRGSRGGRGGARRASSGRRGGAGSRGGRSGGRSRARR